METEMLLKGFAGKSFPLQTAKVAHSLAARTNNLFQGSLKEKIFFLHIPKCGGSSLNRAIKSCYLNWNLADDRHLTYLNANASFLAAPKSFSLPEFSLDVPDNYPILKFRENILLYSMCHSDYFIGGHFSYSQKAYQHFSHEYAFITVLREPVSRFISAYFYNRYKPWEDRKISHDITEYLDSDLGRAQGHEYVKYLRCPDQQEDYTSDQAIGQAIDNLHKFSIVSCLEHQDDLQRKFQERFKRALNIKTVNRGPKHNSRKTLISNEIKEKIREICQPDLTIYQYVIDNFVKTS